MARAKRYRRAEEMVFRYLCDKGDGTGVKNAVENYSSNPTDFYVQAKRQCVINMFTISIEDNTGMHAEEYGNLGSALTNGWELKVKDENGKVKLDITDGLPIRTNAQIGRFSFDVDVKSWGQTRTDELLVARWSFYRSGMPILLLPGDKMVVTLSDDFSGLIEHYFKVHGYETLKQ